MIRSVLLLVLVTINLAVPPAQASLESCRQALSHTVQVISSSGPAKAIQVFIENQIGNKNNVLRLNTVLNMSKVTYPDGPANGELVHITVNDEVAKQVRDKEGKNFVSNKIEINDANREFMEFLGFTDDFHPVLGQVWKTIPTPALFMHRRELWNRMHADSPEMQIHIKIAETGADMQLAMTRLWAKGIFSFAKLFERDRPNSLVSGIIKLIPSWMRGGNEMDNKDLNEGKVPLEVAPKGSRGEGRVPTYRHLWYHDVGELTNSLWMNKAAYEKTIQIAQFNVEILDYLKEQRKLKAPGAEEKTEVFRFNIHRGQRGLHSFRHVLSFLIQAGSDGLNAADSPVRDRGPVFEVEWYIHLAGLGRIAPGSKPSWDTEMIHDMWKQAKPGPPVTVESALDFITNVDIERIQKAVGDLNDPAINAIYDRHAQKGTFDLVSRKEIEEWANLTRWRYHNM